MNTPTPRTDGALFLVARLEGEPIYMVSPEHARELERELAEARLERAAWRECADKLQSCLASYWDADDGAVPHITWDDTKAILDNYRALAAREKCATNQPATSGALDPEITNKAPNLAQ